MDFDTEFEAVTDALRELNMPLGSFAAANKLLYRAYYIGKAEAVTEAKQDAADMISFMDISLNSAMSAMNH